MNTIVKWFQERFSNAKHKLTVAEKNRKLMHDNLQMCFTIKHINRIKDVLIQMNESFDVNQRISFTLEILYRERMIIYCKRKLKKEFYTIDEVYLLLQQTTEYFHCDAIMLHIESYKTYYLQSNSDLSYYEALVERYKALMFNEIEVIL